MTTVSDYHQLEVNLHYMELRALVAEHKLDQIRIYHKNCSTCDNCDLDYLLELLGNKK